MIMYVVALDAGNAESTERTFFFTEEWEAVDHAKYVNARVEDGQQEYSVYSIVVEPVSGTADLVYDSPRF